MPEHTLDWSYAFTNRLKGSSLEKSEFAAKASECEGRLRAALEQDQLPFISFSFGQALVSAIESILPRLARQKDMLVLGVGGSALGAKALQKMFYPQQDGPGYYGRGLWVADNIDAAGLEYLCSTLVPKETVVLVTSKSGGTIETVAQYFILREWLREHLPQSWQDHIIVVTDEERGFLREEAKLYGYTSLPVPSHLGGRFSVFSAVGALPAAFLGIEYRSLLAGAKRMATSLLHNPSSLGRHPAWHLAIWNRELMKHGYSQLIFFSYVPHLQALGAWFSQLWAESLGKSGRGSMPIPAVGVTDQHSLQQMFLDGPRDKACLFISSEGLKQGPSFGEEVVGQWGFLQGKHFGDLLDAEAVATRMALQQSNMPLAHIRMGCSREEGVARLMQLLMLTTLFTGWLLGVEPLDQPAVEFGKRLAYARLGATGYTEEQQLLDSFLAQDESSIRERF